MHDAPLPRERPPLLLAAGLGDLGGALGAALLVKADAALPPLRLLESRPVREPLFEHRLELAGYETRALELEGDGPPLRAPSRLRRLAPTPGGWCSTAWAARAARALAVDLPGFGEADDLDDGARCCRSTTRFAGGGRRARRGRARRPVVLAGNSLGGCIALRPPQRDDLPLAGIVPVAPAGLDMPRWFSDHRARRRWCARCSARARRCPGRVVRADHRRGLPAAGLRAPARSPRRGSSRLHGHHPTARHVSSGFLDLGRAPAARADARRVRARARSTSRCCSSGATATAWSATRAPRHVLAAVPGRALRGARRAAATARSSRRRTRSRTCCSSSSSEASRRRRP